MSVQQSVAQSPVLAPVLQGKMEVSQEKIKAPQERTKASQERIKASQERTKALQEKMKALQEKTEALQEKTEALEKKTKALQKETRAFKEQQARPWEDTASATLLESMVPARIEDTKLVKRTIKLPWDWPMSDGRFPAEMLRNTSLPFLTYATAAFLTETYHDTHRGSKDAFPDGASTLDTFKIAINRLGAERTLPQGVVEWFQSWWEGHMDETTPFVYPQEKDLLDHLTMCLTYWHTQKMQPPYCTPALAEYTNAIIGTLMKLRYAMARVSTEEAWKEMEGDEAYWKGVQSKEGHAGIQLADRAPALAEDTITMLESSLNVRDGVACAPAEEACKEVEGDGVYWKGVYSWMGVEFEEGDASDSSASEGVEGEEGDDSF